MIRKLFVLVFAFGLAACADRQITERFDVSGWHTGDPAHKSIQFVVNGDLIGPPITYGKSSGTYVVEIVVGRGNYNTSTGPSNGVTSANVVLGVMDVETKTIFLTTQSCYVSKYQVTNFMYERSFGRDSLYCR